MRVPSDIRIDESTPERTEGRRSHRNLTIRGDETHEFGRGSGFRRRLSVAVLF